MNLKLFLILACIYSICIFAEIHSGTITWTGNNTRDYGQNITYTKNNVNTVCKFTLTQTSTPYQSMLMIVKTSENSSIITNVLKSQHFSKPYTTDRDLQNANKGEPQIVEIRGLSAITTFYIYVLVFDQKNTVTYKIDLTQSSTNSHECQAGHTQSSTSIFCINCQSSLFLSSRTIGSFCKTTEFTLTSSQSLPTPLSAGQYKVFVIPSQTRSMSLVYVSDKSNLDIFVQIKINSNEMAGFVNYYFSNTFSARYKTVAFVQNIIRISSAGNQISIAVKNQNGTAANFYSGYSVDRQTTSSSLLIIILSILGGVLFIALVIAAFFILKRATSQQMIHPRQSNLMMQQQQVQNNLSALEIQMYFPSVTASAAFGQNLQSSSMSLNKDNTIDRDCVICLCAVQGNDNMKVTYCRHIFHSHCLTKWFQKQRNCPYCRQQYSKSSTVEHYQQILNISGRKKLGGRDLVEQIIKNKIIKSKILIEDIKDEQI